MTPFTSFSNELTNEAASCDDGDVAFCASDN